MTITLTTDQQNALNAFQQFLCDPVETVFVLSGYSGTGKTTLIKHLLEELPSYVKTAKLLLPTMKEYYVELTATTNKAAEAMSLITGRDVATIHSFLGLRVQTDYSTGVTTLIPRSKEKKEGYLLFIDEASYIDSQLLELIFTMTSKCKIVFMGDPAQLTPVKSSGTPVFEAKFSGAKLTQVVRQAEGNPIVDLSTKFRETVSSGQFFSFKPDGHHIKYLDRPDFYKEIEKEFSRTDWHYSDSKILGWTNKCVVNYNHAVSDNVTGNPKLKVGDYAIVNKYVTKGKQSLKTDEMVYISHISAETSENGVDGHIYTVDRGYTFFMPKSMDEKNTRLKQAKADNDYIVIEHIESSWIDLRAAYACTINKSQGSTFDRVFIDLDDVKRCNSGDQIARMLYVGISRAKSQVFLTGDVI